MGLAAESAVFGHFGAPRSSRVLCAACGRFFAAQRPSPGDRVRCSHCSETVEVGAPVVRKGRRHSSRTSIASWADEPRSATAEAVGRVAICVALAASVLYLLDSIAGHVPAPEPVRGFHDAGAATPGGLDVADSGEW